MSEQSLLLKWGSLKGFSGADPGTKFREAIERYYAEPVLMSAALQKDTDTQKQAVLDIIEACEGEIINDWSGERMTKDEAKKYVTEYRRK